MAGLGGISIDLEARIARFESDIGRAARLLEREMSRSAAQSSRAIEQMRQQVDRQMEMMRRQFSTTGAALLGFLSVRGAIGFTRELTRINDGFVNLQTALKQVTNNQSQLTAATKETFNISQRTYQSFESTAMLVGRTARALTSAGNDQANALKLSLKFSESINNAFILSGAKAIEAKNALLQLSQGLSSGALRGDEYRSVAEQGSKVTEILAKNLTEVNGALELANGRLGITTGRLRELAYEGKLTTDLVVKAMVQSFAELSGQVGSIPLTIERAFTTLTNAAEMYIGTSERASAVGLAFANSLKFVADNFALFADAIIAVSMATVAVFGSRSVSAIGRYISSMMEAKAAQIASLEATAAAAQGAIAKARADDAAAAAARRTAAAEFAKAEALNAATIAQQQAAAVQLSVARAEVARQEVLLSMARTTAVRVRAESQLQVALASQTVAQLQNISVMDAAAVSSNRLLVARQALVAANADLAVAERALAAAQLQGAGAAAAATGAAVGLRGAAAALGSGLLALVGGPVGAAVLGIAAIGYALFELKARSDEYENTQRSSTIALEGLTKGILEQVEALKLQASGMTEAEAKASTAVDNQVADLVVLNQQMAFLQEQMRYGAKNFDSLFNTLTRLNERYEAGKIALRAYTDALVDLGFAQMQARDAQSAMNAAMIASGKPIEDAIKKLKEHTEKLNLDNIELTKGLRARMLYEAQAKLGFKTLDGMNAAQQKQWELLVKEVDAIVALTNANKKLTDAKKTNRQAERDARREQKEFLKNLKEQAQAVESARKDFAALQKVLIDTDQTLSGPMRAAMLANIASWEKYDELVAKFLESGPPVVKIHDMLAEAMEGVNAKTRERVELAEKEVDYFGQLNKKLSEEIELIGMSESDRRAELLVREAINASIKDGIPLTQIEIDLMRSLAQERVKYIEVLQLQADEMEKTQKTIASGFEDVFDAFADQLASGEADWSSFADTIKNIWKRTVADIIAQSLKLSFLNPMLNSLFGMNLPTGASGGGLGGSGGMGGMFSSAMPWLAAAGAAYAGYNMHQGQSAGTRLGAVATYGTLGYVGGTVALGASLGAAGAASGAGAAAAAGGAATGAMGAAAAIPIIGWVLAAIAAVDWATGGRVMGTDYRPERYNSTLGVGENGAVAQASVEEWRYTNANPFRDFGNWGLGQRRSRTRNLEAPDELTRAADMFYQTQLQVAKDAARRFKAEVGPLIEGTFTQVLGFTKKGKRDEKKDKTFAEIMGKRYEGITQEEFAMRMSGFQILSQIANNLSAAQIGEGGYQFNASGASGAIRPGNREFAGLFEDIAELTETGAAGLSDAAGNWQASIDAIMTIAARWDDSAEMFAQGAEFLLMAAVDLHNGVGLLGDAGTLAQITDFVEELALAGETLGQTYSRLVAQTLLLETALDMMGVTLSLGREEFVLFADGIAEAAGGLQRASDLWSSFFETFYTDAERGAMAVEQAREAATREFEDIGLSAAAFEGQQGLTAFREAFLAVAGTLTPEEIVEWLEAGQALGNLNEAITALAPEVEETVEDVLARLAELEAARASYAEFATDLFMQLEDARSSEFVNELRAIAIQYNENREQLHTLARAAGLAAAREEDLANALELATIQRVKAIRALEAEGRSLVADLGYGRLGILDQQIADMEAREREAASAVSDFGDALGEVTREARDNINLLLGDLSPLRDREKLALALEAQRGGRIAPEDVLEIGRRLMASGSDYQSLFNQVLAIGDRRPQGGGGSSGGGGSRTYQRSPELEMLIQERDRLAEEANKANRFLQASELAQIVADLAGAQDASFEEVAQSLGFSLDMLAADLNMPAMQDLLTYLETLQANSYSIADIAATITAGEAQIILVLEEIYDVLHAEKWRPPRDDNIDPPNPDPGMAKVMKNSFDPSGKEETSDKICQLLEAIAEHTGVGADLLEEIKNGDRGRRVEIAGLAPRNQRNGLSTLK